MLEKEIRSNNITELDEEKLTVLNEIDSFEEKIIQKIKNVADASREEVRSKHEELVNAVKQDIRQLETVASVTEESLKTLNNCTSQIKSKLFLSVKMCEQVVKDAEILVENLPCKWPIRRLDYCIDYDSPHNDTTLKTFGHFIEDENKPSILLGFSERYNGVFDVKLESDEKICVVSCICFLEDGMYGISDFANHKLKRFSKTFELYDSIDLDGGPTSACLIGTHEVALTLGDKKMIQFVSCTGTLSLGNSFPTENNCYGISLHSESKELFVCCGNSVCVYDKNGTLLKTIEKDITGKSLFSDAKQCVIKSNRIYFTDCKNGLIALNKNSEQVWSLTDTKLEESWGICMISSRHLLVASSILCNVLLVNNEGNVISEVLREETGMKKIYTLAYDRQRSTVMLGGISNKIYMYHLWRK
jgi:hypothetical protein